MGLRKSDLNGEVTILLRLGPILCTVEYDLGLIKGDHIGEVTLLVSKPRFYCT